MTLSLRPGLIHFFPISFVLKYGFGKDESPVIVKN